MRVEFGKQVTVYVHPIDPGEHPGQHGFRWAVHIGGEGPCDLSTCLNAGHANTRGDALVLGESHGVVAVGALRYLRLDPSYRVAELDHDPIPGSADHEPMRVLRRG